MASSYQAGRETLVVPTFEYRIDVLTVRTPESVVTV
jgi:hypothetical protein